MSSPPLGWLPSLARPWRLGVTALLFLLFLALEIATFRGVGEPRYVRDTNVYMSASELPLLSKAFLLADKPIATVLLYKATLRNQLAIARFQSLLSVIAWFTLGLVVAAQLQGAAAQTTAVVALATFSFLVPINQWDFILLSESISLSLLALAIAATVALTRQLLEDRATTPTVAAWAGVCLLLALARDSNIYLLATLLGVLFLWLGFDLLIKHRAGTKTRWDARLGAVCLALAFVVGTTYMAMKSSDRWHDPLVNVLLRRIVRHPDLMEEFAGRYSMPRNPEFERYGGKKAWARVGFNRPIRERFWHRDPAVEDIRQWLMSDGMRSYQLWILRDQTWDSLQRSALAFKGQVSSRFVERQYGKEAGHRPWTLALTKWSYRQIEHPMLLLVGLFFVSLVLATKPGRHRLLSLAAAFLVFNAWAQAFITYHADTSNLGRHMLASGLLMRLAILLLVLAVGDRLFEAARRGLSALKQGAPAESRPSGT